MKISLKDIDWLRAGLVLVLLLDLGLGWFAYQAAFEEHARDAFGEAATPGIQIGEAAEGGIVDLPAPTEEEVATRVAEAQALLANWDPFKDPTLLLVDRSGPDLPPGTKPVVDVSQFTIRALLTFGRDRYVLLETKGRMGLRSFTVGARLPDDSTVLIHEITRDGVLFTAPDREPTWLRIPRAREGRGTGWFGRDIAGETRGIRVEITER